MGLTEEEWEQLQANMARRRSPVAQADPSSTQSTLAISKHRNRKTLYQGLVFDSVKECTRWQELQLLERVGAIKDLRRQVSFDLYACNGERIAKYIADFTYYNLELGCAAIEDAKSPHSRTLRDYRLKFKLMRAQGQKITEV